MNIKDALHPRPAPKKSWGGVWWLCLASLVFTHALFAQEPEASDVPTSEENEQVLQDAQAEAEQRAREAELARELELRLQSINDLQGDLGIYAPQLQEAYGDLASLYHEMEDYESAITIYTDALQISRINTGLYSDQQLPIIQSLIDNNGRLRNWEEADDLHELRYHISTRLYEHKDLAYLNAAQHYGEWKLRVLRENLLEQSYRSYSSSAEDLSEFYERLISTVEIQPSYRAENMIPLLQGKSEADLVLVQAIASTHYSAFEGTASPYVYEQRCRSVRNTAGQIVRECVNVQVPNPRYAQSQVDAKRFAMSRSTRAVQESIDKLREIALQSSDLGRVEREQLESQIAQLETRTYQLQRQSRSRRRF